MKSVFS